MQRSVWFVIGLIQILILLRFTFLVLGARATEFTRTLYAFSEPFVAPFQGIFPSPQAEGSVFEAASLVALLVYSLVGIVLASVFRLLDSTGE